MTLVDFFIGFFLMNAMPHFVLGTWKARILSAFGFGNKQNITYGLLNFGFSISLFMYKYGWQGLGSNGIYLGCLFILIIYFISGNFLYKIFSRDQGSH